VKLRDGTVIIDKFRGDGSGFIELEAYGKVRHDQLVSFSIHRKQQVRNSGHGLVVRLGKRTGGRGGKLRIR
jgi:hypothetical protein